FNISGSSGDHLEYLVRNGDKVIVYSKDLGDVHLADISSQYTRVRELVEASRARDLRRGLTVTLLVVVSAIWIVSLVSLVFVANRISRPIQTLTGGISQLASGDLAVRLQSKTDDEAGQAIQAFNHMADQLQQSRERLVYLTQVASWQM